MTLVRSEKNRVSRLLAILQLSLAAMLALPAGSLAAQETTRDTANRKPTAAAGATLSPQTRAEPSGGDPVEAFPHTVRVLSYNIHHAEGIDGRLDLERIAKTIQSVQPDIVALQEVDARVERSKGIDQPQELARMTGMKVAFGPNIDLQGGQYGNAVLSRGQQTRSENRALPNIDQGEQRGVLEVLVQQDAQTLRVLATHFDHRRDAKERLASIDQINRMVAEQKNTPSLLIGDLNAEFSSEVLDRARALWKVTNRERMPTIPVTKPERQIDFVLCYPPDRWHVTEVKVLDEAVASDHRPILAVLRFR
jgi:endonuclease/exonuclease/phosphatase family metal-dependent hydrolase